VTGYDNFSPCQDGFFILYMPFAFLLQKKFTDGEISLQKAEKYIFPIMMMDVPVGLTGIAKFIM